MVASRPVEIVINHVLTKIAHGHFAAGQRLTEADLMLACKVGTGPVREALRILSGEGVVEIIPNKGARIHKLTRKELVDILRLMGGVMTRGIELSKGKLAGKDARTTLIAAMASIHQLAEKGQAFDFMLALGNYHLELNKITENEDLNYMFNRALLVHFYRELANTIRIEDWDRYLNFYNKIHEYILKGDVDKAAKHYKDYTANLIEKLSTENKAVVF